MFGSPDTTVLTAARAYVARGWNPVPVGFRKKKRIGDGWQHRRIDANNAAQYFNCGPMNVGVQLGRASGGLVDVDLDCAEALYLVDAFLPPTASIFGRAPKPRSHRLYRSDLCERIDDAALQFKDPEAKGMLVELRIGGGHWARRRSFPARRTRTLAS